MALSLFKAGIRNQLSNLSNMFNEQSETVVLRIPMMRCNEFLVKLHDYLIHEEGVPSVAREDNKLDFQNRLILLGKNIDENLSQIPVDLKTWILEQNVEIKKFKIVKDINTFSLEEAIEKVIHNKDIDSHIKLETLKQFKIIELKSEQQPFKEQIANLVLDKSPDSITTVLEKRVEQDDQHFFSQSYEYILGEKKFYLDLHEGSCKFLVDISRVFINNYFQEERDRLLNLVKDSECVVNLFGDIILDTRLFKERNAKVHTCVTSVQLQEQFQDAKNSNNQSQRSASRSLSKSSNQIQKEAVKGTLDVECKDIFNFLEDHFKQEQHSQIFIISRILKDLSFLCAFVGIQQNGQQSSTNGNDGHEEKPVSIYFYYLVNEEEYKNKSLSELIIDNLNQKIIKISSNPNTSNIFEKSDLGSVTELNFDMPNKKLIGVNLKIKKEVLNHASPLINQVKQLYKSSLITKNENGPQDLSEYEGELQKKVKV